MPEVLSKDIGTAEIQYLHYDGDGPVVVLLHATGFQPWLWHPVAREMAGDFRVVAPYFCDHRVLEPHEGGLSWILLAEDLTSLMRGLEIEGSIVVGHSMGATVAAIAEAGNPGLASRLVLIEPIFLPQEFYTADISVEQHPLASRSIRRRSDWADRKEAQEYLRSKKLFEDWDKEMLSLYLEYGMTEAENGTLSLACRPEREAALFMGGMDQDPWPLLSGIQCPVLLVEGGRSENSSVIDLERAAELMQDAELRVVPGAGHLVPMEKPREVLDMLRDYLGEGE